MRNPDNIHRRHAVHAGRFYPASGAEIKELFESWAHERKPIPGLVGMIVPHAGYMYSGHVAARGYSAIPPTIKRVFLVGLSHNYPVRGIAVWNEGPWETPLGDVEVDRESAEMLFGTGIFHPEPPPFMPEHSLEVQMPFIKHFLPEASVVPMIAGSMNPHDLEEAAAAIGKSIDGETLIIASSDLYHGNSYEECVSQDSETLSLIKKINGKEFLSAARQMKVMACGDSAIALLLETAAGLPGSVADVLVYTNSAEVTGDRAGYVVGYAVVAITAR